MTTRGGTRFADRFRNTSYLDRQRPRTAGGFIAPTVPTPDIGSTPSPSAPPNPVVEEGGGFYASPPPTSSIGAGPIGAPPSATLPSGGQITMPGMTDLSQHPAYASLLSGKALPAFTGLGGELSMPEIGMGRIPSWNERASQFWKMSPYMQKTWLQDIWGPASGLDPNQILDFILEQTPGYRRYPFRTLRAA